MYVDLCKGIDSSAVLWKKMKHSIWVEWHNCHSWGVPLWRAPRPYVLPQRQCRMGLLQQAMVLYGHESIQRPQGKKMPQTPT